MSNSSILLPIPFQIGVLYTLRLHLSLFPILAIPYNLLQRHSNFKPALPILISIGGEGPPL